MRYLIKVEGQRPIDVPKLSGEELTVKDLNKLYSIGHHRGTENRKEGKARIHVTYPVYLAHG